MPRSIIYSIEGLEPENEKRMTPSRVALMFLAAIDVQNDNPGISDENVLRLAGLSADIQLKELTDKQTDHI